MAAYVFDRLIYGRTRHVLNVPQEEDATDGDSEGEMYHKCLNSHGRRGGRSFVHSQGTCEVHPAVTYEVPFPLLPQSHSTNSGMARIGGYFDSFPLGMVSFKFITKTQKGRCILTTPTVRLVSYSTYVLPLIEP